MKRTDNSRLILLPAVCFITSLCLACSNLNPLPKTTFRQNKVDSVKHSSNAAIENLNSEQSSKQEELENQVRKAFESLDESLTFRSPEEKKNWFQSRVQGDIARNANEHAQAVRYYTQALSIKPEHKTYFNRALSFTALSKLDNALADYDSSLELQPDLYEAWYNRGTLLSQMRQYEASIQSYDEAILLKPDHFSAWHNRGYAQGCLSRHEDAIETYEKLISINPAFHQAWNAHGTNLAALGRNKAAIASLKKALEGEPDNLLYKQNLDVVISHAYMQIPMQPCGFIVSE